MRLEVRTPETLDRDMGVDLRRGEAGVAEHLLDRTKIGAPLEQVGGRAMPQPVWSDVRRIGDVLQQVMDRAADLTWVDTATSSPKKQGSATKSGDHLAPTQL